MAQSKERAMSTRSVVAVRRIIALFAVLLMLALLIGARAAPSRAHPAPGVDAAQAALLCDQIVAVPPGECAALVDLYNATDGPHWIDDAGWLTTVSAVAPCDWHGVVCASGHI